MASATEELSFWFLKILMLILNSVTGNLLGMLQLTWVCELTFSNVNFMKSKYRASILNENLASELRNKV